MNRGRNYNRFQKHKTIKRKVFILKNIKKYQEEFFCDRNIGKLAKGKIHCSCKLCKFSKHYKFKKPKIKQKISIMNKEIAHYLNR